MLKPLEDCLDLPRDQVVRVARYDTFTKNWEYGEVEWMTNKRWAPWTHLVTGRPRHSDTRDREAAEAVANTAKYDRQIVDLILFAHGWLVGVMTSILLFLVLTWRSR